MDQGACLCVHTREVGGFQRCCAQPDSHKCAYLIAFVQLMRNRRTHRNPTGWSEPGLFCPRVAFGCTENRYRGTENQYRWMGFWVRPRRFRIYAYDFPSSGL